MDKEKIKNALDKLKADSKKRNFKQTVDLIVNLKGVDLKKDKVEYFVDLHYDMGKKVKICALVGPELYDQAKKSLDNAVRTDEFPNYAKDKKLSKKLAKGYDLFLAQANIMAQVAASFGRTFGPLGKMPNPKAGCVVLPTANLSQIYDKMQKLVVIKCIKTPVVQISLGVEDQPEEKLIDNILTVMNGLENSLPNHMNSIGKTFIKFTMSKPIEVV